MQKISIVIPTKNEEKNLGRCLGAIKNSSYKNIEIIVVDQSSTDTTQEIAKSYGAQVINLPPTSKYVPPSNSRNVGFEKSSGDMIYHMDADMEVTPDLLSECVKIFNQNSKIVAIVIPEKDVPLNFWAKGKAFERSLYYGTEMEAARVSLSEVFAKVKYSKEIFSGEDWNIDKLFRENGEIGRTKNVVNHHIGKISIVKEFRKKMHYGIGSIQYVSENSTSLYKKILLLLKLYLKGIIVGVVRNPLACLSFILIRFVDVIGLLIGYVRQKAIKNEKHS